MYAVRIQISQLHPQKRPGATADMSVQMCVQCSLEQGWSKRVTGFQVILEKRYKIQYSVVLYEYVVYPCLLYDI